jgi:hypothetical protein
MRRGIAGPKNQAIILIEDFLPGDLRRKTTGEMSSHHSWRKGIALLPSFEAYNFRTFSELRIGHLGGVNLVVGRNNAGKSMLLEAVRLYASSGNEESCIDTILSLLYDHDELLPVTVPETDRNDFQLRFTSLLNGRSLRQEPSGEFVIQTSPTDTKSLKIEITSRSVPWHSAPFKQDINYALNTTTTPYPDVNVLYPVINIYIGDNKGNSYVLNRNFRRESFSTDSKGVASVPAYGIDISTLARQWDLVVLRSAEAEVIQCMRIVYPIEKISAVEHPAHPGQRMFIAQAQGEPASFPLKSLGDGLVRIFQFAIALETAKNGSSTNAQRGVLPVVTTALTQNRTLLIDEVENGIHYTVLPDLWRFLFNASRMYGVQIFATTHSWDCVEAFQKIAAEQKDVDGTLIRLEKSGDRNKAVTFSEDELAVVTRDKIEVR